jgi:hypothetical protein
VLPNPERIVLQYAWYSVNILGRAVTPKTRAGSALGLRTLEEARDAVPAVAAQRALLPLETYICATISRPSLGKRGMWQDAGALGYVRYTTMEWLP